jgi:outer membrane protein OmpA-like peptidoglycan-associated protein
MLRSDLELLNELEHEFTYAVRRPRLYITFGRSVHRESETDGLEAFDPVPLEFGTTILPGFDPNSSRLKPPHIPIIKRFARQVAAGMMLTAPTATIKVEVEGHEDETGDPARFKFLGLDRAKAVAKVLHSALQTLIDKMPPGDARETNLIIKSLGPTRPIRSNVTAGGRAMNRRVALRIL